jgi:hypothetical protein
LSAALPPLSLECGGGFWDNLYRIRFPDLTVMKMSLFMHGDELLAMVTSEKGDERVIYNVENSNSLKFLLGQKIHGEISMLKVYHESLVYPLIVQMSRCHNPFPKVAKMENMEKMQRFRETQELLRS